MAKKDTGYTFKDSEISLEEGKLFEHKDDAIKVHDLWAILKEIEANGRQDLSIKSTKVFDGQADE